MITDKDREELIEDLRAYNDAWVLEEGKDRDRLIEFESAIRAESAEQAMKEAAEKLAIAVKALEVIRDNALNPAHTMTKLGLEQVTDANRAISDRALKEIQG